VRNSIITALTGVLAIPSAGICSPGDTVGWTQYDMQSNGSSGTRVALDGAGGVHFTWMKSNDFPSHRGVAYNYRSPTGEWLGEIFVAEGGSGYPQLALATDNRAVILFHRAPNGAESLFVAIDVAPGLGLFNYYKPPNRLGQVRFIWPYVTVDRQNRIHLIATNNASPGELQPVMYTRSENGGTTWVAPQWVDTVQCLSSIITASRVSDKVAIVYTHPTDSSNQWLNDLYYIQSSDGLEWDFDHGKVNFTNYVSDPDSLYAYTDIDAVYDYNDNLHFIWTAQRVASNNVYYPTYLFHADIGEGVISTVTIGFSDWPESGCNFGSWNRQICKMSLGVHQLTNSLFAVYTRFDSTDCSLSGYANGELFMQNSSNLGQDWSAPINLTNSLTPSCSTGYCESDHWSSLAEVVDDYLHIFYVNDKDPGRASGYEGFPTNNPMLYLAVPNPAVGVDDGESPSRPENLSLSQNHPNPFNSSTTISYTLPEKGPVTLSIYNLLGQKVATLFDGVQQAGEHKLMWDATGTPSGVYFARLEVAEKRQIVRMVLLK